jgi:hypothetical protein
MLDLLLSSLPVHWPSLAYLDPGAGSMMLQVLLGGTAAVLVVLKLTWRRLLNLLSRRSSTEREQEASVS